VTLTTFLDQTTDQNRTRPDLETEATAADLATLELETASEGLDLETIAAADPAPAVAKTPVTPTKPAADADDADEPATPAEHDDLLDIEDSTRLYLREIARVPLLTAEEEVMLAKTMELGKRIESDPASAIRISTSGA